MSYTFTNDENTSALRTPDNANIPWDAVAANGPLDKAGNVYRQWVEEGSPVPAPYVMPTPAPRRIAPARLDRLYTAVDKAAAGMVDSLVIKDWNNKATWSVFFNAAATQPQKDAVNAVIASYDYQAVEADDPARSAVFLRDAGSVDLLDRLRNATPAQIESWIDTNVTDLASARQALKLIVKVLARIA